MSRSTPSRRRAARAGDPRQGRLALFGSEAVVGRSGARPRVSPAAEAWGMGRPVGGREWGGMRLARGLVLLMAAVLILRVAYLQTLRRDFYLRVAEQIQPASTPQTPPPGRIYDREGRVLADSEQVVDLVADPVALRDNEDLPRLRATLQQELGLPAERLDRIFDSTGRHLYLARRVPPAQAELILAQRWTGISREPTWRRVYPHGEVAAHLLGAYSGDRRPLAGLDLQYRFVLEGQPGTPRRNVDAWGRTIVGLEAQAALPSSPGRSLLTTLDLDAQRATEAALDRLWEQHRPDNATAVVLEPRSGRVLALASRPSYDPNHIAGAGVGVVRAPVTAESLSNLPVVWEYEPGSTFKLLMAAAALETGAVKPGAHFACPGTISLGGRPLRCWGEWQVKGHGSLDLAGILARSCNLGAAQVALAIGAERYVAFLRNCGLGRPTRVGLPGEAAGLVPAPESLRTRDLANLGFGQHLRVTPLQLAAAVGALCNEGVYMQPHLVERVLGPEGEVEYEWEPAARRRVCSVETSRQLRRMMVGVVEGGTGRNAALPGVKVGGKTGTAQVYDPQTGTFPADQSVVSFIMAAPADRAPDYVILVTAMNPKVGRHGSDVAAPAAREIAAYLLQQAGLLPWGATGGGSGSASN